MERYPFIFSDEKKYRIARHFAFWFAWWIAQGFLYSFIAVTDRLFYPIRLKSSMIEALVFLIPHMFLSYSLMYYVVPKLLLKQRYWLTAITVLFLFVLTALISAGLSLTLIREIRLLFLGFEYVGELREGWLNIYLSLMAGLRGGITVAGIAAAIKLMKYWYVKEQRNLQLQKENVAAQLQLLRAQVHPHFLFNTLNNIYSYTQKVSPIGSRLVIGLSDLLRYILQEGSKATVPLSKELGMIDDYITLEQIRYGDRLDINKDISPNTGNLVIAPLLLLPLVENCFKHGTSHMLEQAWIRFAVDIDGNNLKMTLINAKVPDRIDKEQTSSGIGISNVKKRLELLYPGKHELVITDEVDVFIVKLKIELEKGVVANPVKQATELINA